MWVHFKTNFKQHRSGANIPTLVTIPRKWASDFTCDTVRLIIAWLLAAQTFILKSCCKFKQLKGKYSHSSDKCRVFVWDLFSRAAVDDERGRLRIYCVAPSFTFTLCEQTWDWCDHVCFCRAIKSNITVIAVIERHSKPLLSFK